MRGIWGQALPLPRLPAHWAGCWGPLPTCCGRGRVGVGAHTVPLACTPCGGCVPQGWWGAVPLPGLGLCAPRGAGPWRSCGGGRAWGGGGVCRAPRLCGRGGPVGRGVALLRSVPLPSLGRQKTGSHWRRSVHGGRGPPYHAGSCSPAFIGRDLCGVLARWRGLACSPRFLWDPAAGAGGRAALRLLSRGGGGRTIPPASGDGGRGPRGLRAGGGGRIAPRPPCSPSGWRPVVPHPGPPLVVGALPPGVGVRSGSRGCPGVGGVRGGLSTAPPGAPADLNPPSALPEWAVVMGGSWGARPPYCSGALPCAAPRLGPRAAPARWCGLACRPRPPREKAAEGAGARGVQVQPHPPPPPRRGPFWGRGGVSSAPGGRRVAPVALKLEGGSGGGVGGPPPRPPAPSGVGLPSVVSGVPPQGILVPWGLPGGRGRRARPGRPPMNQCGGSRGGRAGKSPRPGSRPCLPRAGL